MFKRLFPSKWTCTYKYVEVEFARALIWFVCQKESVWYAYNVEKNYVDTQLRNDELVNTSSPSD